MLLRQINAYMCGCFQHRSSVEFALKDDILWVGDLHALLSAAEFSEAVK